MTRSTPGEFEPVEALRRIPFVRDLVYSSAPTRQDLGYDGRIDLHTATGDYHLLVEAKRSFLTRSTVSQLLAWVKQAGSEPVILLARHVPRPVAARLIAAGVNFADDSGNVHLFLDDRYNWTDIGRSALQRPPSRRSISPAQVQLLVQFATDPNSVNWPVRRLEAAAGVSKSKAAQARHELRAAGLLVRKGKLYQLGPAALLDERLVPGYADVLRPKLLLGTFRPPEKTVEAFLARLRTSTPPSIRYALTGGPAADILQRYYHGTEIPMFLEESSRKTIQDLRLLPDSNGPVTLLRAFGDVVFWRQQDQHWLAPPWLIYAELLQSGDPRAQEAAQELKEGFLP